MIAPRITDNDRAQLDDIYREWRNIGKAGITDELHIAIWKFATTQVGDDLGHDVCMRVARHLNQLKGTQPGALPKDLIAYLYQSCRNARTDLHRQTRKYMPILTEHFPGASGPFYWVQADQNAGREKRVATIENCRAAVPAAIAKLLDLDNLNLVAASENDGANAAKLRRRRAKGKSLLTLGAAALLGYPTPQPLSKLISSLSSSLRGGPWEKLLAIAPRFRDFSPDGGRNAATALIEAAQPRFSAFVNGQEGIGAFKDAYNWFRTAALLCPAAAADSFTGLKSSFFRFRAEYPLAGRLLDRVYALSGSETGAAEGNSYWHHCLAGLRGETSQVTEQEALFGAIYVIAYYANPRLSWPLVSLLHPLDWSGLERFLKQHAAVLRDAIIEEACTNVAEAIYQSGPHAEANFVRVQLGLTCLSRYSPGFGKGYARLTPETAMQLAITAHHTARSTANRRLRQTAEGICGSLIYVYDLKWREFSRRCERALRPRRA